MPKKSKTDTSSNKEGKQVVCKRCGYIWKTESEKVYVTCPSCLSKNKIRELPEITSSQDAS